MVELAYSDQVTELVAKTRTFIEEVVAPVEDEFDGDIEAAGGDEMRLRWREEARALGIYAPHAPAEYGGAGLSMSDRAPVFEAAGYSLFGPAALHLGAPDEGNVHLLGHAGTPDQREEFLAPLALGDVRSAFAMTEPAPGAGSDPRALNTRAEKVPGGWKITGRKWFISGAEGAAFYIIMARTAGEPGERGGATMFLSPADAQGISIIRHVKTIDLAMIGGHCEVHFDNLFVPDAYVLGEVDRGFEYAQVRLGPGRMSHCMRWLGAVTRGHDAAVRHVIGREAFGSVLADQGMIQGMIADNEIDMATTRALIVRACWELDQGDMAGDATSIAKTFSSEAMWRIVDRSMQMCGGAGISADLPIARLAREVRPFRIYDGPSEVHRWALAKRVVRQARARAQAGQA